MATPGCEHVARGSPSSPARARERGKIEAPASGGALGRRSRAGGYLRAPFRGQPHVCSPPPVGAMAGAAAWLRLSLLLAGASCCRGGLTVYLSSWAVQVPAGAREAERLARKHGLLCLGQIIEGDHYYHFKHRGMVQKSLNRHWGWHVHLKREPKVHWFEQQTLKRRTKRTIAVVPTDPWFHKQWYMNNDVHPDLNILTAWSKGYTGLGVVLSILDDGLERDHPDLSANYDPLASYDFNSNDPDPQPRYNLWDENRHGTRCAGEVAAAANNRLCGVGVAYNAKIGGVRMLDGPITDIVEAQSLSFHPQHIHIYSASWGPEDDGKTVDGPGILALEAFYSGIANGRGGLGSLFVWASGNGGLRYDNCNCDGYTNSIYTLSVGSATENGRLPWYSEACASTLTATYSSGTKGEKQIVTTDLRHRCTDKHTGTSASAPLAAGMIALALEANPALTWRDIQHLVVRASKPAHLQAEDWALTGVGRKVSHHYGYGLLDAGDLVDLARKWTPTGPQRKCSVKVISAPLKIGSKLTVSKNVSTCLRRARHIRSLEHVQVRVSLSYSRRGDLAISLSSPMGTTSTLVAVRPYDTSTQGYKDWSFMSTHFWDEDPRGTWTLFLENKGDPYNTAVRHGRGHDGQTDRSLRRERVCEAGRHGGVRGMRQPLLRLPAPLPVLLPSPLLQPIQAVPRPGGEPPRRPGLRHLPPVLLHLPGGHGQQLHRLPALLHLPRALPLLLPAGLRRSLSQPGGRAPAAPRLPPPGHPAGRGPSARGPALRRLPRAGPRRLPQAAQGPPPAAPHCWHGRGQADWHSPQRDWLLKGARAVAGSRAPSGGQCWPRSPGPAASPRACCQLVFGFRPHAWEINQLWPVRVTCSLLLPAGWTGVTEQPGPHPGGGGDTGQGLPPVL
ncbi:proprotein convertase subtilisin/kexin type 4 isoform X2 [Pelodiscus sinensis]|uniref:proprotein convertase subtilisin/kexin type 4 isoform X2 n=1 Tax=Pelodiscus sinensis TaxID=13735 RepID=UPI003F6AB625